ncbi:methyltransferase family protein [Alicyclobacillus tolerans]|uniref:Protein-S-isoprenylcysteine O-methyltransferase Ste14 n=1 Tax=Alicyclobacillus tolerans TaxID=90970 RepID=A0A1M6TLG0_9BACL|nr:isoprenylcysteine carboxylmethyltransferase family protein [Alicyclobacillus montanus]SHK57608.1 Protein-S-isoprenylcysteine O-methyltransferase Ste14 [Alicyclobacillus montanus]
MNVYSYEGAWFWILFYLWVVLETISWVRARMLRRGQPRKQNDDRGSAALIMIGMYVLLFISITFSIRHLGILPRWTQYISYVLMIAGMIIRFTAIIQLGRFFSPVVGVVSNQEIVQSGLYRRIRHPAYTGGFITAVGIGLGLRTWWGVLLCGIGLLLIYAYRIRVEEKVLVQHFGEKYLEYRKRTWRMFPGIW